MVKLRSLNFSFLFLLVTFNLLAQNDFIMAHERVALRSLGHELLLANDDSTSRVLPVFFENNRYVISFSSPITIDPGVLSATADRIFTNARLSENYIVEVQDCLTGEVHYSYEKTASNENLLVPCSGRILPEGCFKISILQIRSSILSSNRMQTTNDNSKEGTAGLKNILFLSSLFLFVVSVVGYFTFYRFHTQPRVSIQLGNYQFFEKEGKLQGMGKEEGLTGKEAELLLCLYAHKNNTIEKAELLKNVWGDEGDYIGRTLDVYISRLRKKLSDDTSIKIQNIRGIGYRLVV